jgi:hypothetical protein
VVEGASVYRVKHMMFRFGSAIAEMGPLIRVPVTGLDACGDRAQKDVWKHRLVVARDNLSIE